LWNLLYREEKEELTPAVRQRSDGSFVALTDGITHYELGLPPPSLPRATPLVLVHGFSVPYFIWEPTFQALTQAGWPVVRYDLFGRGLSDRPRRRYDLNLFLRQLSGLLDALGWQRVDLIGLSMGGAIAAGFSVRAPQRVRKLVLIDPIGVCPMPLPWMYRVALLPGVGELLLGLFGAERMVRSAAADFFEARQVEMFQERYRQQMRYRGFMRAILSTVRSGMLNGFPEIYRALGRLALPLLLLWGREDRTLPLEQSRPLLDSVPHARLHVLEGCGHIPHYERPEVVNPLLIEFLSA